MAEGADPGGARVSIVLPCYDEAEVLGATLPRLAALADRLAERFGLATEIVAVDDGSADATLDILRAVTREDPRLRVVALSRNFGHQIAVTAGIDAARGDAVALIDADLQDPPERIEDMVALWREGYDVVYGRRTERPGETAFKRATAAGFYRLLDRLSEVSIPLDTGDFRLMSRPVVEALKAMPERHRFLRGMVAWAGFRQTALPYARAERAAGRSKYPLGRMLRLALDGILSFSARPLQIATGLGVLAAGLALLGILYALVLRLFTDIWVEGWTLLFIAVLFLGGVQLVALGIIGEYVGRIYDEAKRRPLYLVRERIGFEAEAPAEAEG